MAGTKKVGDSEWGRKWDHLLRPRRAVKIARSSTRYPPLFGWKIETKAKPCPSKTLFFGRRRAWAERGLRGKDSRRTTPKPRDAKDRRPEDPRPWPPCDNMLEAEARNQRVRLS